MEKQLPDLPGSRPEDLQENPFHSFFKKTPREVWDSAAIEQIEIKEPLKCEHIFVEVTDGVECKRCHMGLTGEGAKIVDGKLVLS